MLFVKKYSGTILFVGLTATIALMSNLKYYNLNSTYLDLGMFLNTFHAIDSGQWSRIFLSHVQPYLFFWSLLYGFFPWEVAPIIILAFQATLLALPILWLYRQYGSYPAVAFSLYFPLWYNGLFDFHPDHLAVPLLVAFFLLEKKGKIWSAVTVGMALALVKEIFALQAVFCGLYLFFIRNFRREGLALTFAAVSYLLVTTQYPQENFTFYFFDPVGGETSLLSQNTGAYSWLGTNLEERLRFIFTKPHLVVWNIISNKDKMTYLLYTLGALGFIPILKPSILIVTIPIFAASLLSSFPSHYGFTQHYTAGLIGPLIISFAEGLPKARKIWSRFGSQMNWFNPLLLSGLIILHILLSPSPMGRKFFSQKSWLYNHSVYLPSERNQMIKSAIKEYIPNNPTIILSLQNSLTWSYLTPHKNIFLFPHGASEKTRLTQDFDQNLTGFWDLSKKRTVVSQRQANKVFADYVILDMKRPWFMIDQGCQWIGGECRNGQDFIAEYLAKVEKTKERFDTIFENDGFMILKGQT